MNFWEWPAFWDDLTRLGAAALLGGAIGLEREWNGHWAGLRTHIMVAIGCAIFVIGGNGRSRPRHRWAIARDPRRCLGHWFSRGGHDSEAGRQNGDQRPDDGQLDLARRRAGHAAGLAEYALAIAAAVISLFVLGVLGPVEKVFERRTQTSQRIDEVTNGSDDVIHVAALSAKPR